VGGGGSAAAGEGDAGERSAGTPVPKKLGVKDGMEVVFQGEAPAGGGS